MRELAGLHQGAGLAELGGDHRVGVENELPAEKTHIRREPAAVVDRRIGIEAVGQADVVVLAAVAGCGVHAAGAGVERHVRAEHDGRVPVVEGVAAGLAFEPPRVDAGKDGMGRPAEGRHAGFHQVAGQHINLVPPRVYGHVLEVGVQRDGQVGREGPGRGRPDDDIDPPAFQHGVFRRHVTGQGEFDEDRVGRFVLVLDFGLGQGGLAGETPVDGLLAAGQVAGQAELHALAGDDRLVGVVHGEVRVDPVPHDPQTFELAALDVDEPLGIGAAELAHPGAGKGLFLLSQFLVDIVLDRQAVAVPSRDINCIESRHLLGTDDDVLQNLVEGGPDVDVPVGVRRTVVQDERRTSLGCRADRFVKPAALPLLQLLRLAPRQVGFHGKGGRRQVERLLVIHHILPGRRIFDPAVLTATACGVKEIAGWISEEKKHAKEGEPQKDQGQPEDPDELFRRETRHEAGRVMEAIAAWAFRAPGRRPVTEHPARIRCAGPEPPVRHTSVRSGRRSGSRRC